MRNSTGFRCGLSLCIIIFCLLVGNSVCHGEQAELEDVVYLKNGSIIHGTIVETVPGESVKIETHDGNVFVFNMDEVERLTKELKKLPVSVLQDDVVMDQSDANLRRLAKKSGGLAFLLSFVVPGGGQFYNGENRKGAVMLGSAVLGGALILIATTEDDRHGLYSDTWSDGNGAIGVWIVMGSAIWSMIDAPISSARINRKNGLASGYRVSDNIYVDLNISEIGMRKTPTLQAVYTF